MLDFLYRRLNIFIFFMLWGIGIYFLKPPYTIEKLLNINTLKFALGFMVIIFIINMMRIIFGVKSRKKIKIDDEEF